METKMLQKSEISKDSQKIICYRNKTVSQKTMWYVNKIISWKNTFFYGLQLLFYYRYLKMPVIQEVLSQDIASNKTSNSFTECWTQYY